MRTCPRCGTANMTMQVQAVISAPSELEHQFSKKNLRNKEVYLMGVLWETADFICRNVDCQKILSGYGNYVSNLKKNHDALQQRVKELEEELLSRGG